MRRGELRRCTSSFSSYFTHALHNDVDPFALVSHGAISSKRSPRFIGELERGVAGSNIKQVIRVCRTLGIDLYARVRGQ